MDFQLAPDIKKRIKKVQKRLNLTHLDPVRIICFRSTGSKARARARIWGFPRIWQMALKRRSHYCLEVISENFDHLSKDDQVKILIHELMHIPQNFSGALLPHGGRRKITITHRNVNKLFKQYKKC